MKQRLWIGAVAVVLLVAGIPSGQSAPPTLNDQPVHKVVSGVIPPRAIATPGPIYPLDARAREIRGIVVVRIIVGPDGKPHNIQVARHLDKSLDDAAIEAVKEWRFKPATKDGQPVAVMVNVELNFHLY